MPESSALVWLVEDEDVRVTDSHKAAEKLNPT